MPRFMGITTMSLVGSSIEGVQSVMVRGASTEMEYEGDNDLGVQDVGVTGRMLEISVEVKDSDKNRDIKDPVFTDKAGTPVETALNEVLSAELSIEGEPKPDSAEDDTWLTYIGVRGTKGRLVLRVRDSNQVLGTVFFLGVRGAVDFDLQTPLSTAGLPDSSSLVNMSMDNLVLIGKDVNSQHKEIAEATLEFACHGTGGAAPLITGSAIPVAVAATGTTSFVAKSATGGSDVTVSIANSVVTRIRGRAEHGGIFTVTYELQAYSSDGSTSPMSIS